VRATGSRTAATAAVGLAAGFLSGLFGIGGGILIVPGLVLVLRMDQRVAHGTSLAAILPIAVAGVVGYALENALDWSAALLVTAGGVVGAVFGTRLLGRLPERTLRLAFAAILAATAIRLLVSTPSETGRGPIGVWVALALVGIGLVSGVVAGLLGVGGGVIVVPALVVLFSVPGAVAKGTSLLVIVPTAISGTAVNWRRGNLDVRAATIVGLAGAAAAYGGSKLSTSLGSHLSSLLFAVLLLAVALQLALARPKTVRVT